MYTFNIFFNLILKKNLLYYSGNWIKVFLIGSKPDCDNIFVFLKETEN